MIQNTEKYKIEKKLFKSINDFLDKSELYADTKQTSILSRFIIYTLNFLSNSRMTDFECVNDVFHHKYKTDSIGTFYFFKSFDPVTKRSMLYVYDWDWRIDVETFRKLYPLLMQEHPIYEEIGDYSCGFKVVNDARGYFNYIDTKKELLSKKEWFQKAIPFQNINDFVFAYVRRLNGDACYIFSDGTLGRIDDNYTRQNAQALLGESRIHQIIMEVLNQYLRQNLILN